MAQYDKGEQKMESAQSTDEGRILATVDGIDCALTALVQHNDLLFSRIGEVLGPDFPSDGSQPSPQRPPSCPLESRLMDQLSRIVSMSRTVQAYTARIKL